MFEVSVIECNVEAIDDVIEMGIVCCVEKCRVVLRKGCF